MRTHADPAGQIPLLFPYIVDHHIQLFRRILQRSGHITHHNKDRAGRHDEEYEHTDDRDIAAGFHQVVRAFDPLHLDRIDLLHQSLKITFDRILLLVQIKVHLLKRHLAVHLGNRKCLIAACDISLDRSVQILHDAGRSVIPVSRYILLQLVDPCKQL